MSLGICCLGVLASLVFAATGADAMGQAGFAALAVHDIGDGDMVVGTAHVSSGLGCFLLWQWHDGTSILTTI